MGYTSFEEIQIGIYVAGAVIMLATLLIALISNKGKRRKERALFSTLFFIIDVVMLVKTLFM